MVFTTLFRGLLSALSLVSLANAQVTITPNPGLNTSTAYDGYRVYSLYEYSGQSAWDIATLSFYTDADCATSSKVTVNSNTATLISSGQAEGSAFHPTSAFDDSDTTVWKGRKDGNYFWLGYELGQSAVVVKCITIDQGSGDVDTTWLQDAFSIQGNQKGGEWDVLYDVADARNSAITILSLSATWSTLKVCLFVY